MNVECRSGQVAAMGQTTVPLGQAPASRHPPGSSVQPIASSAMGLRCARIECGDQATSSLLFKAERSEVHLIDLADATEGIPLCGPHARTRTAPVGWDIIDLRSPARAESWNSVGPIDDEYPEGPEARPPRRRATDQQFRWDRAARSDESISAESSADLDAHSPLLARAFGPVRD